MKNLDSQKLAVFLETENQQLKKLNDIVIKSIEEEKLLSHKLLEFEEKHPTFANRLADKIAEFGGSWKFILVFLFKEACKYFLTNPISKKCKCQYNGHHTRHCDKNGSDKRQPGCITTQGTKNKF